MDLQTPQPSAMNRQPGIAASVPGPVRSSQITFQPDVAPVDRRPRSLTPEALVATELIVHAMQYLSDSREFSSSKIIELDQSHPDAFALLLLMEAKYHVYVCCPVVERRRSVLGTLFKGRERRRQR